MDFSGFNFGEVFVAALAAVLLETIWYSKTAFGQIWSVETGLPSQALKERIIRPGLGLSLFLYLIIATILSIFVEIFMMIGSNALMGGLFAAFLALVFVATSLGINALSVKRSRKLYFIDAGFMVVAFFIMGTIIGAWY